MAKKNQVYIDIVIDDNGTTKRVAVDAGKLGIELDKSAKASEKGAKSTEKLSKSQKNLDRNMRGTAKMSGNTTKEFSKMQQGMGGVVGAYATLAAQVFAVSAAFQFLQSASDLRNLIAGQEAMGAMTGTTYKSMTASIVAATDAQLKYADAAKAAAIGTAAGLTGGQLSKLAVVAKNASFALGRDLTDSFNRLVRGVTKAEPELLDELGIILRLEVATKKYAESLGKNVKELNAYERTQAVTNEVLEQGVRKFAKIEALMDPQAATLAQFTKSFDELSNTFKIGLINTITPALSFLANNTMGLVATLALVGTPILKAILPNMDMWIERNEKLMKVEGRAAKKRDKNLKAEQRNLKMLSKTHAEYNAGRTEAAQRVIDSSGAKGGAALDTLGTGASTPGGLKASQGMIDKANAEISGNRKRTGALASMGREDVSVLQASLDSQLQSEKEYAAQQKKVTDAQLTDTEKKQQKRAASWGKANTKILQGGKFLATGVNLAFKAIAIFGLISLLVSAAQALYRLMNPLTDLQKSEAASATALTEKYKILNEELRRNALARKTILSGGASVESIGNSLQGADVPGVMDSVNQLGARTDTKSDEYKEARKEIMGTILELTKIDSRFQKIYSEFRKTGGVSADSAAKVKVFTNELIEAGRNLASLPGLMKATNTAFSDLGKDSTQNTNLSKAVDTAKKEMDAIGTGIFDSKKKSNEEMTKLEATHAKVKMLDDAKNEVARIDAAAKISRIDGGGFVKDKNNSTTRTSYQIGQMKKAHLARIAMLEKEGVSTKAQYDLRVKTIGGGTDEQKLLEERLASLTEEHAILKAEESRRIAREHKKLDSQIKFAANRAKGITIEGKLFNLEEKRFNSSQKVIAAEDALADAKEGRRLAEGKDNEASTQESVDLHKKRLEHARVENKFRQEGIDLEGEALVIERARLAAMSARVMLERQAFSTNKALNNAKALSGGSDASITDIRNKTTADFKARIRVAAANTAITNKAETEQFAKKMKARMDIAKTEAGGLLGFFDNKEIYKQITDEVKGSTGIQAESNRKTEASLRNQLMLHEQISYAKATDAAQATLDDATARQGTGGFRGAAAARSEADVANRASITGYSEAQIKSLGDQAVATFELTEMERKRGELADGIQSGMTNAFMAIVDGTKSAKAAFADMAASFLKLIAKMIMEALVLKMLQSAMPSLFGAKGGTTVDPTAAIGGGGGTAIAKKGGRFGPGYAAGGYSSKKNNFSRGGMARGAQAGYAATLHGNEAVVPLPDNRSIPVTLNGAGGQNNNVVVNVSMDGQGGGQAQTQGDSGQARAIGQMVASAVQQELQHQKRSGGILSPYGVS